MLAPKLDEFLVVAVLGSAVVDHFHVCNQTAKNTMRTGSCSCSPKTFQHTTTFHPPIPPLGGITGAKSCATLMAIYAVPALVRTCQHIRPFATRTVRDSPPLHCQKEGSECLHAL